MISGVSLAALAIAAATATLILIIREIHIRALNTRVSKAVMGVPGQSAPLQDVTDWFSSLGMLIAGSTLRKIRNNCERSFNRQVSIPIEPCRS
jgi:tight adherence protein C